MKKIAAIVISLLVVASMVCGIATCSVAAGPAPESGDGSPSGNQFIQPEAPGDGPAPNCGDGVSDGSGF